MNTDAEQLDLLEQIANGDQDCMRELINQYSGLVWSLVRRKISNAADAEDLVQDIFAEIWKSAHRYKPELGAESTFIAVITRRRVIDTIRKNTRHATPVPFDSSAVFSSSQEDMKIDSESEVASVTQLIHSLSPQRRRVLELSVIRGLSHSQIVEATDMPLGTVKAHIRRGLEDIRDLARSRTTRQTLGEVSQ
jgi:RNA polymerase sigma-70 factor (ECF subfamily)